MVGFGFAAEVDSPNGLERGRQQVHGEAPKHQPAHQGALMVLVEPQAQAVAFWLLSVTAAGPI